jgi:hypothetical protein
MQDQCDALLDHAIALLAETGGQMLFVFLGSEKSYRWFQGSVAAGRKEVVVVVPRGAGVSEAAMKADGLRGILSWAGTQSRFSQIKYAFLQGVLRGFVTPESRAVCLLGPYGKDHLDTITVHDLHLSWGEDFPFDPRAIIGRKSFKVVMAMVDVALDLGLMGREGRHVGTTFVIGDSRNVMRSSHQAVFNPFKGYSAKERSIDRGEVVESIKELAQLDGAIVISSSGIVEAAGRHLETPSVVTKQLRGLGSRHRSAAGITRKTKAVAVVVSESTGRVTIFDSGRVVSTLEPVLSSRLM